MADTKTYLNVPFAQKDAAKALGARWDPAAKKWYVPADKDLALFAQWQGQSDAAAAPTTKPTPAKAKPDPAAGVMTYATDKNFVAYDGDTPPWD
ncbi:MAG: DUF5710 domain-containing protein [Methylococcales bacterium]|nr:DUF5710 domain-containing protein [Methylococcales bacterium]